jgi:hypothetical protein
MRLVRQAPPWGPWVLLVTFAKMPEAVDSTYLTSSSRMGSLEYSVSYSPLWQGLQRYLGLHARYFERCARWSKLSSSRELPRRRATRSPLFGAWPPVFASHLVSRGGFGG